MTTLKTKHTEGPWEVLPQGCAVRTKKGGNLVCDLSQYLSLEKRIATARLIASAPELLKVCKLTHALIAETNEEMTSDQTLDLIVFLREALTKAGAL